MFVTVKFAKQIKQMEPNWRPQSTALHYTALYMGIYEYLRETPDARHEQFIRGYLTDLQEYPNAPMQRHRIMWTTEWLAQLPPRGPDGFFNSS